MTFAQTWHFISSVKNVLDSVGKWYTNKRTEDMVGQACLRNLRNQLIVTEQVFCICNLMGPSSEAKRATSKTAFKTHVKLILNCTRAHCNDMFITKRAKILREARTMPRQVIINTLPFG